MVAAHSSRCLQQHLKVCRKHLCRRAKLHHAWSFLLDNPQIGSLCMQAIMKRTPVPMTPLESLASSAVRTAHKVRFPALL